MTPTSWWILGIALALAAPVAARGQQPDSARFARADVAFGVAMNDPADVNQPPHCTELRLPCTSPRTMPDWGVALQAAFRVNRHAALVADGSVYGNSWVGPTSDMALTNHVAAVLVGPRLTTSTLTLATRKDTTRLRLFGQFLAGSEASTVVPTRFALQPGAGLDGKLGWAPGWVRIAYDYRYTRGSPRNLSGSRILCALVVDFAGGGGRER